MLRHFYFLGAVFWTLLVAYLCLTPSSNIPNVSFFYADKAAHFLFHFIFTSLWTLSFKNQIQISKNRSPFLIPFLLSVVFGISIEILQDFFTSTRYADIFDVFANILGASLSVLLIKLLWNRKTNML